MKNRLDDSIASRGSFGFVSAVGSHRLSSDKEGTRAVAREKRTNETMLYRMARKVKRLKRLMGFDEYIPGRGVGWGEVLFMPTCLAYEVGGNVVLIFIGEK